MTGNKIAIPNARLAFTDNLFRAGKYDATNTKAKDKYGCKLLIPKTAVEKIKEIEAELHRCAVEEWKEKANQVLRDIINTKDCALGDGDRKEYAGHAGHVFLSAKNQKLPTYVHANPKKPDGSPNLITEASGVLYAGCYVNAIVSFWTYKAKPGAGGNQIHANLLGLQFVADGEAFGGGGATSSVDEFKNEEKVPVGGADGFSSMFT